MRDLRIIDGDLGSTELRDLIAAHHDHCAADTQAGKCHRLDLDQYATPDLLFWSAWSGEKLVGMIALKQLGNNEGEVKSMHVRADARGLGVAEFLLTHVIAVAKDLGVSTLLLETGDTPMFAAARAFYTKHGFEFCSPFGAYTVDNAGPCMRKTLG